MTGEGGEKRESKPGLNFCHTFQWVIQHTMLQSHLWRLTHRYKQCHIQKEATQITLATPIPLPIHSINFTTTINITYIQLLICYFQQLLIGNTKLYSLTSHKAVILINQSRQRPLTSTVKQYMAPFLVVADSGS